MNLMEAKRTGLPYRRRDWSEFAEHILELLNPETQHKRLVFAYTDRITQEPVIIKSVLLEDVFADDYELDK